MKIAVVIPAFNAEKNIVKLVNEISLYVHLRHIIVVDDGSSDNTFTIANNLGINVLRHKRNFGKGKALYTGFKFAVNKGYEAVIFIDSDFQHQPKDMPKFIEFAKKNQSDVIIGTRKFEIGKIPFHRYLSNKITSLILSLIVGKKFSDTQSGYRMIKTKVLGKMNLLTHRYETESEILLRAGKKGFNFGELPIDTIYKGDETSYINPILDTLRFVFLVIKSWWW